MLEEKLFAEIKEKTGWDFHSKDDERAFGFIQGSNLNTFNMWKRKGSLTVEVTIKADSGEESLEKIIKFLNDPFPVVTLNGQLRLVGEHDRVAQG